MSTTDKPAPPTAWGLLVIRRWSHLGSALQAKTPVTVLSIRINAPLPLDAATEGEN